MVLTRLLVVSLAAATAGGARIPRRGEPPSQLETKFIADVPITNYHLAYTDDASFVQVDGIQPKQDWTVVVDSATSDETIHKLCQLGECKGEGHPSKGGVPFFEVRATEEELEQLVRKSDGAVKFVEPDSEVSVIPDSVVTPQSSTWNLNRIRHSQRRSSGYGVRLYVFDTGIRKSHQEFRGRAVPSLDMTNGRRVCSRHSSSCAADKQGHGTHVAGVAGGARYGVAPQASLLAVKTMGDDGKGRMSWTIEGLDYVASQGGKSRIASMSLGSKQVSQSQKAAVDAAVGVGVIVVVAAGNEMDDACKYTPSFIPSALTIGATDSEDSKYWLSNFGRCVYLWAPGSEITGASLSSNSATRTSSGTSYACPHVAGAAALILEGNPRYNTHEVHQRIKSKTINGAIEGLQFDDTNRLLQVNGF